MEKVLLVDDEPNILSAFRRRLASSYEFLTATSAIEALKLLEQNPTIALVVSDMNMPGINGSDLLKRIAKEYPNTVRIMLTGLVDQRTALKAINDGEVFRFLTKPCSAEDFEGALRASSVRYNLEVQERDLLQKTLGGTINLVTDLLSLADPAGMERSSAMRKLARELFSKKPVPLFELELAVMMSRIGLLSLPLDLLKKIGEAVPLLESESKLLTQSMGVGARLLKQIPRLEKISLLLECVAQESLPQAGPIRNGVLAFQIVRKVVESRMEGETPLESLHRIRNVFSKEQLDLIGELTIQDQPKTNSAPDRYSISLSELCPGQVLIEDACDDSGKLLLKQGSTISEAIIARLRNHNELVGVKVPLVVNERIPTRD